MEKVDVVSTVSGGSLLGAYYLLKIERALRTKSDKQTRADLFVSIEKKFRSAVQKNMRMRSLIFSPFHHPLMFIRALFPRYSRTDIIQKEYDQFLYDNSLMDDLPTLPKLVVNCTDLHSGDRVGFSVKSYSKHNEQKPVNKNKMKLSKVAAASAAVPGLFVPVIIQGKKMVDGGVVDNQGLTPLLVVDEGNSEDNLCDIVICSDSSGQLEPQDSTSNRAVKVLLRTSSLMMNQIRKILVDLLNAKKNDKEENLKEFAFFHLQTNLKRKDPSLKRLRTEFINPCSNIRTDLDSFSDLEIDCLMYHGYTLVDYHLKEHCPRLFLAAKNSVPFDDKFGYLKKENLGDNRKRAIIKKHLNYGSSKFFRPIMKRWNDQIRKTIFLKLFLYFGLPLLVYNTVVWENIIPVIYKTLTGWTLKQIPYIDKVISPFFTYFDLNWNAVGRFITSAILFYISFFLFSYRFYKWSDKIDREIVEDLKRPATGSTTGHNEGE